jgi:vacuolar-type H+-ATPase subunit I/STV1
MHRVVRGKQLDRSFKRTRAQTSPHLSPPDRKHMKTSTLDALIWVLIYGGLLSIGLGVAVQRSNDLLGWSFVTGGALAALAGAALVFVRSRIRDEG